MHAFSFRTKQVSQQTIGSGKDQAKKNLQKCLGIKKKQFPRHRMKNASHLFALKKKRNLNLI